MSILIINDTELGSGAGSNASYGFLDFESLNTTPPAHRSFYAAGVFSHLLAVQAKQGSQSGTVVIDNHNYPLVSRQAGQSPKTASNQLPGLGIRVEPGVD